MLIKIIIFGALLFGTVLFDREFLQPRKMGGALAVLIYCVVLFGAYLILLYLEIRSRIPKSASQKQLRRVGFHLTFWAGVFWGVFIASPGGFSWFADPLKFFGLLGGLLAGGVIFGLLGMAITQFMLLLVFKLPDQA